VIQCDVSGYKYEWPGARACIDMVMQCSTVVKPPLATSTRNHQHGQFTHTPLLALMCAHVLVGTQFLLITIVVVLLVRAQGYLKTAYTLPAALKLWLRFPVRVFTLMELAALCLTGLIGISTVQTCATCVWDSIKWSQL
jgi:hypothetical protein